MPFLFEKLDIEDIVLIKPKAFPDDRGFFMETYKKSDFILNGINADFIQDNHSRSSKGVLRGLHYQIKPHSQGKLVRCVHGEIFDVAVDIRKSSPTFGKWVGARLSEENRHIIYIPSGFAHGFVVLSDTADIIYKVCGGEYAPESERGIIWNDPEIGIDWGINNVILSDKDTTLPLLKDAEVFE